MKKNLLLLFLSFTTACLYAQQEKDSLLTIDRIYNSGEFAGDYQRPISWIDKGEAFVTVESNDNGEDQLERYESKNYKKSTFLTAAQLTPTGKDQALRVEDFTLSPDESKVLIFTNSSRVWRSNTKGDFWVFRSQHRKTSANREKISFLFADVRQVLQR